jgi:hypothetical protein
MVFDTHTLFTALLSHMEGIFSSFPSSLFFTSKLGCVKIVNYFSHDLSIGRRRKSFKCRILMEVQIVSRVAHAIIYENAPRATHRRKRWNGSDQWAMSRWSVKRQIRLLSQVNLNTFFNHQGMVNFLFQNYFNFNTNFFKNFKDLIKCLLLEIFSILPFIWA